MKRHRLCFVSSNRYKFDEFARLFARANIQLEHIDISIAEVQLVDMDLIIQDKVVKAYRELSRPLMVDHSGLAMKALNDFPQGLNKQFWEILKDKVCDLAKQLREDSAHILVNLGFCDGYKIYTLAQRDPGRIAPRPSAKGDFHLDRIFIPTGASKTLAEMSTRQRDNVSYRRKAFEQALDRLRAVPFGKQLGLR